VKSGSSESLTIQERLSASVRTNCAYGTLGIAVLAKDPLERSSSSAPARCFASSPSVILGFGSLLFEADCTGDQMEAALLELDRRAGKQELALTIASIAVGALVGVAAGVWDLSGTESRGPAALGITGGAGTAVLGIAALTPKRGRVVFAHDRNLFLPILDGEDPERLYPPFVFSLMSSPRTPASRPRVTS
jgi:hypothetical protein